jgi:hypothetical protein
MSENSGQNSLLQQPAAGWRLKLGIIIFMLSIILPVAGIPAVTTFEMTSAMAASVSGALLVGAEILGIIAIAVMGKSGFDFIKNRVFSFLKQYGPPNQVGRLRYTIGLILFCAPLLFALLSVYVAELIPGFVQNPLPYAVAGDLLLLLSLFVLGGDFWDKIRALFIYNAKVRI